MAPEYRADIDGLRAIAVLAILFYHAGIDAFRGGFVGVDIFFVISGFLITSIIVREIQNEQFSLSRFYERRIRRIIPALVVVVLATLALGFLVLDTARSSELGKSAIATSFFSSNVYFYLNMGYFDGPAEYQPLLHTWSLAVEEQFYIVFPFILLLIARLFSGDYKSWVGWIFGLSLLGSIVLTSISASAAFYLIPTRAWELLIGSLLALGAFPKSENRSLCSAIAFAGATLILASVFWLDSNTSFPGIAATMPTFGAAMLIYSGGHDRTMIHRALSIRPMVFVGLISYSLYLWHWPVIVYAKYFLINELTDIQRALVIVFVLLLSVLSWRFVETPFRKKEIYVSKVRLFAAAGVATGLVIAAGVALTMTKGNANNVPGIAEIIDEPSWQHWKSCTTDRGKIIDESTICRLGRDATPASFLLWGDSHAVAYSAAVHLSAKRHGIAGQIVAQTACPPLLAIERENRIDCDTFNRSVLQYVESTPEIKTVILAARWALSATGTRYKDEPGKSVTLVDVSLQGSAQMTNLGLLEVGMIRTIRNLRALGKMVVLVDQAPEIGFDVPSVHLASRITGRDANSEIGPTLEEFRSRTAAHSSAIQAALDKYEFRVVDISSQLCDDERCKVVVNGTPVYRDDNHLSIYGAYVVSQAFDEVFRSLDSKPAE